MAVRRVIFDSADTTFDVSVRMVSGDIAKAIIAHRESDARMIMEKADSEVLAQQAHLLIDY